MAFLSLTSRYLGKVGYVTHFSESHFPLLQIEQITPTKGGPL